MNYYNWTSQILSNIVYYHIGDECGALDLGSRRFI